MTIRIASTPTPGHGCQVRRSQVRIPVRVQHPGTDGGGFKMWGLFSINFSLPEDTGSACVTCQGQCHSLEQGVEREQAESTYPVTDSW